MRRLVLVLVMLVAASGGGVRVPSARAVSVAASASATTAGAELARADFDADGFGDLAVGMPGEDVDTFRDAGALAYFQGPLGAPDGAENRPLHQDSAGVPGAAGPGDHLGAALGPGPAGNT